MTAENENPDEHCECDSGRTRGPRGLIYACANCGDGDAWADAAFAEDTAAFQAGNAVPLREARS